MLIGQILTVSECVKYKIIQKQFQMSSSHKYVQQIDDDLVCPRCNQNENTFLTLECEHGFCIVCITYMYLKFKEEIGPRKIKCIDCDTISTIDNPQIQLINQTIQQQLLPAIHHDQTHNKQRCSPVDDDQSITLKDGRNSTINKNQNHIQHSFQRIPPVANNFYSRCQSPKNTTEKIYTAKRESCNHTQPLCKLHYQQLLYVCFTCGHCLLCLECISMKKHRNHEYENLAKSVDNISQDVGLSILNTKERIQIMELSDKKISNYHNIVKERLSKTVKDIEHNFTCLINKIRLKSKELTKDYARQYEVEHAQLEGYRDQIRNTIQNMQEYLNKLEQLQQNKLSNFYYITSYNRIKHLKIPNSNIKQPFLLDCRSYMPNTLCTDITAISDQIDMLKVQYRSSTTPVQTKVEQKTKKEKRAMVSPISSRQKKKGMKTEEDDRRNKSNKMKTEAHKHNIQLPSYITKFFDKPHIKPFSGTSCLLDMNNLQHSIKMGSKILSKTATHLDEEKKKRKEQTAFLKERLERKTVNHSNSSKQRRTDVQRKKKLH